MYHTTTPADMQGRVLQDITPAGKVRPWASHKSDAQLLSYALELSDKHAAQRVRHCADTLWFRRHEDGTLRLDTAQFCRVRLCPVCQWRRSLKMYGQLHQVVQALAQQRQAAGAQPYAWLLLTLTVRNCSGPDLSATLDTIAKGWDRLCKTQRYKRAVRGTMRAIEITYNRRTGQYHPHMHVLCAVLPSYYTSRDYIKQAQWTDMWRDAARLDYTPVVDVRRATGTAGVTGRSCQVCHQAVRLPRPLRPRYHGGCCRHSAPGLRPPPICGLDWRAPRYAPRIASG